MDLRAIASALQDKEWSVEMPGKFADLDFDFVAAPKPSYRGKLKVREFRFLIKILNPLDAKAALVWQTHFDTLLKRATRGFISSAELPQFLLCLAAKEMTAEAIWMAQKDLNMFHASSYNGNVFAVDQENHLFYGHSRTLEHVSMLGIKDLLDK